MVSTSHAVAKSARARPGALHLSYIFTPMRYVWDLEREYFPPGRFPWPISTPVCAWLRRWDRATSTRPDAMIAISRHVAARIRRHYGREAAVIYPPVELERFTAARGPRDYYLLRAPYKRGDLAIEACRRMGGGLVAGTGLSNCVKRLAGPGVEFRGVDRRQDMAALYAGARGLLFPGRRTSASCRLRRWQWLSGRGVRRGRRLRSLAAPSCRRARRVRPAVSRGCRAARWRRRCLV